MTNHSEQFGAVFPSRADRMGSARAVLSADDPMRLFCKARHIEQPTDCAADFLWEDAPDMPFCWESMRSEAKRIIVEQLKDPEKPVDASVGVWVSKDRMEAWCAAFPPLRDGKELTAELLNGALKSAHVTAGVDEALVEELVGSGAYLKLARVAAGVAPQPGEDGRFEDLTDYDRKGCREDEHGRIDFRELTWIIHVKQGQPLCEVFPPTAGSDGFNVAGLQLRGRNGKPVPASISGKNTAFSEDGRYVVAGSDGQVIYANSRYNVEPLLTINGNVDYSTGNIHFNGSVIVTGDVCPSFQVEAAQDITVQGTVEGGTLIAGGSICVHGGVVASNQGMLSAQGDIRCKFMEYGVANAVGDAFFENLIHSDVSCQGDIYVTSGRGTVIGGRLVAMGNIIIKSLGNRANRPCIAELGATEEFKAAKQRAILEMEHSAQNYRELEEKMQKLQGFRDNPQAAEAIQQMETTLLKERVGIRKLEAQLREIEEKESEVDKKHICVDFAYPNVCIRIGKASCSLDKEVKYSRFRQSGGEIVFAPV